MNSSVRPFNKTQLDRLEQAFHIGAADASDAMARWLGVPSLISIESVEQLPIEQAPGILGGSELPICFCSMEMTGDRPNMKSTSGFCTCWIYRRANEDSDSIYRRCPSA